MMYEEEVREIRQSQKELREAIVEIEAERGWQSIRAGENRGLLIARDIVQAKLNALNKELLLKCKIGKKDSIKIRYAYITSPPNVKQDPRYSETLVFAVLTLEEIEGTYVSLEEWLTQGEGVLIKILGRDVCTDRVDMKGKVIYEGDIIRWGLDSGDNIDETIHRKSHFAELDSERDCEVIGTIYDKGDI